MKIIPDTRSVYSGIVITEHRKCLTFADRNLRYIGEKVVWYTVRVFTDQTAGMGPPQD